MGQERIRLLQDYITYHEGKPFEWGYNDCCLFAARWMDLIKGTDVTKDWLGKYNTEEGAAAIMKERGHRTVESIADAHLKRKPINYIQRGDIVSFAGALGICGGKGSFFFWRDIGLMPIPTKAIKIGWGL